jgi:hypothetical protein
LKADHGAADDEEVVVSGPDRSGLGKGDSAPVGDIGEPTHVRVVLGQGTCTKVHVLDAVFTSK